MLVGKKGGALQAKHEGRDLIDMHCASWSLTFVPAGVVSVVQKQYYFTAVVSQQCQSYNLK